MHSDLSFMTRRIITSREITPVYSAEGIALSKRGVVL